jgi:hypothetical protein
VGASLSPLPVTIKRLVMAIAGHTACGQSLLIAPQLSLKGRPAGPGTFLGAG